MSNEISENLILKYAKTPRKVAVFDEVYSTNDTIKGLDVDLVVAKSQTGGRGTNNRKFYSPKGGVYLSFKITNLSTLPSKLNLITPYFAVVTAKAIEKVAGVKCQIKWVNDILINGKKVAGILTESIISGNNIDSVIIGVGINVKRQNFPNFILNTPTSIEEETGLEIDVNRLIAELLSGIDDILEKLESKNFISYYRDNLYLLDKEVKITQAGKTHIGKVVGITGDLALSVMVENKIINFISGDVTVL